MVEYEATRRYKYLCAGAKTIEDMIAIVRGEAILLEELQEKGVELRDDGGQEADYAHLITTSIDVVREYEHLGWGYWAANKDEDMIFVPVSGMFTEWQEDNN